MSSARYIVGNVIPVLATLPDDSVDLALFSPPFLALRGYLPDGHPDKDAEMGSEGTPGEFLDALLDVIEEIRRVLAPHGTLAVELGDTYSGSGGAGGDYDEGGLRDGQPTYDGSGSRSRSDEWKMDPASNTHGRGKQLRAGGTGSRANGNRGGQKRASRDQRGEPGGEIGGHHGGGEGWPLDKSKVCAPELLEVALAYGVNPLTGRRTPRWRVRNFASWVRPNPPVGRDGDKFRPATSHFIIACTSRDRWFDLDAVRTVGPTAGIVKEKRGGREFDRDDAKARNGTEMTPDNPAGAPPLDWFQVPTEPYKGAHYATWPRRLLVPFIKAMCPQRVCVHCGKPSERLTKPTDEYAQRLGADIYGPNEPRSAEDRKQQGRQVKGGDRVVLPGAELVTLGWSECGCGTGCEPTAWRKETTDVEQGRRADGRWRDLDTWDELVEPSEFRTKKKRRTVLDKVGACHDETHWRRGHVLDPFAGSGTTLAVAQGHGRDATGIDLDDRNAALALHRVGPLFLTVEHDWLNQPQHAVDTEPL